MSRFLLQAMIALASLVPLSASLGGLVHGPSFLRGVGDVPVDLDSHFRYLSGLFLGVALLFLSTIPAIEKQTARFRLAAFLVVLGGLGRLTSLMLVGQPSRAHLVGLALELGLVPLLVLWQGAVARAALSPALRADSVPAKLAGGPACASPFRSDSSSSP
jgi:hypothetical protein